MNENTLSDYFEAMTASVFQSGLSAQVVQSKWPGFDRAFARFDPRVVAEFTPEDVDNLLKDESIIRNRRKIEAMVHNANRMLELDEDGDFSDWVASRGDPEATVAAISSEFRFMGPSVTQRFIRMVSSKDNPEVCT